MANEIFKGFEKNPIDKTIFNRSRVQLVKKESVVRLHGAHIRAENISGTNFHISFPKKMI